MKAATILALAGSVAAAAAASSSSMPPIVMKGSKLFYENGTQFFMKGVAYQQEVGAAGSTSNNSAFVDPLSNAANCKRDVPMLQQLGTNIIRTYAIDPTADHSACMQLLQQAGIYVISDLGQPSLSINRDTPAWDNELFTRYKAVVDELAKYPNTVGFFAGNEVSNNKTNTAASAYVKAAVRDTKAYIKQKGYRWMGVGYAANDDADIRDTIADYFNCGPSSDSIDFWGYNIYSWCGESSMAKSGYDTQAAFFQNYSVPVFFAEYGCNLPNGAAGRIWQETTALYSDQMTSVFSGGIVYMYFEEANDYGLVKASSSGGSVTKLADFDKLATAVKKADPKGVDMDQYTANAKAASCPAVNSEWQANSVLPPTPDESLCSCMTKAASCGVADGVKSAAYGKIFGYICSASPEICAGINGNATSGIYGAYSMCSDSEKLTYVLDQYYQSQQSNSNACDFGSQAQVLKPAATSSTCKSALSQADNINKQAATATSAAGLAKATGTTKDDESFGVPAAAIARGFSVGGFTIGLYALVALGTGAGMIML